jgi:diguanylate cyclase (GGDEF)-like protein
MSWPAAVAVVVVILVGAEVVLRAAERSIRAGVVAERVLAAKLVITLTVDHHVAEEAWAAGTIGADARAELDQDVGRLRERGEIVGLDIWGRDGTLLYADVDHPASETALPDDHLARALEGEPFVVNQDRHRGVRSLAVFQLADPARDGEWEGVVEVLLPESAVDDAVASTSDRVRSVVVGVAALVVVMLLALRRRFRRHALAAETDPLTGLANRVRLTRLAHPTEIGRTAGEATSLLMIDLDGFKRVNDAFGHVIGDDVLVEVGRRFRVAVDDAPSLVRLGGDEFALMIHAPEHALDAASAATADLLIGCLRDPITIGAIAVQVGASIGYAVRRAGVSPSELLRRADVAMYQAKRQQAGYRCYTAENDDTDAAGVALLADVRAGIARNEFFLDYQPKVDRQGELVSVEALVRWNHPQHGLLPPVRFIPLVEETTLMKPLTMAVLKLAVTQAAEWHNAGHEIPIAVNVSPRTLLDPDFPGIVADALEWAELPAANLTIELTETAILEDPALATSVVSALRAAGIRVAVDDFGVGFTSLKYLASIPFSELKLDKTFVDGLLEGGTGRAIVANTINLAHDLGLPVTAEGVETETARQMLTELGCDEFQGYLFARPMPAEQVGNWVAANSAGHLIAIA